MINAYDKFKKRVALAATIVIVGCVGGGYGGGLYGNNNGYGNGYGSVNNASPMGAVEGAVLNAIIQSMSGSVLTGQIGSQISPADQNFRLQQLGGLLQSGAVNQAQQWVNPQTGNTITLNPIGQKSINPQTQQQCHNLEETVISKNGQRIQENRLACLNPQTGKWNLVQ
jgi:hypothetical protein